MAIIITIAVCSLIGFVVSFYLISALAKKYESTVSELEKETGRLEIRVNQEYTKYSDALDQITELEKLVQEEVGYRKQILSQKKSSEINTGALVEKLVPIMEQFPIDFKKEKGDLIPIFAPIDYIWFGNEEIVFIEVKSGKSKLSVKQKRIKKLILNKKIGWKETRVTYEDKKEIS